MVKYLKISGMILIALAAAFMLPNLPITNPEVDNVVDANVGATADAAGYTWVDQKNPEPKVAYDWMDITTIGTNQISKFSSSYQYNGVYYFYPIQDYQPLGFNFPFYGKMYDKIQIHPNGLLAFGPTDYGYAIYNYQSALPNTYYYTPRGCIAAYWIYYGGVKNLYTYQGATAEGMKYWVCTWDRVDYYYYLGYGYTSGAQAQAILYENGNIKINIKTGYLYYGYYNTVGICNEARDTGTTYYWAGGSSSSGLPDGTAVLFKQFKTTVGGEQGKDVKFATGYGADEKTYAAMNGLGNQYYWVDVPVYSERGLSYLKTLDVIIGPSNEGVTLRYDFAQAKFMKLNDPARLVILSESTSSIKLDPVYAFTNMSLHFEFDFNLWWSDYDPINVKIEMKGAGVATAVLNLEGVFKVESRVSLVGTMAIEDSRGVTVKNGGWVAGDEVLHFSGITREYYGLGPAVVPPAFIRAGVTDQAGVKYFGDQSDLDLYVQVDAVFPQMSFKLIMDNVTAKQDLTPLEMKAEFNVRIDSDLPGIPGDLKIYADEMTENAQDYDDDNEVYLTWTDAVDASSGVAYYHISVNKDQRHAAAKDINTVPKGTNAFLLKGLPKGINKIYMWTEDVVGNDGGDVFTIARIDIDDPVTFHNFYPNTGIWITNRNPSCSIRINDTITGVDPLTIEYETSTTGEPGLVGDWLSIQESYSPDNSLYIVVNGWFQSGKLNYMRFRARDVAGNGPFASEAFNIWVDAEAPAFTLKSPPESDYSLNPVQQVKIDIKDADSGIDFSTIEYRVSTQGKAKFGPWLPYKDASGSTNLVTMVLKEEFERGDLNYVQVRAKDLVGNTRTSQFFNVKISSYPVIKVSSPSPDEVYFDKDLIVFDATGSYDPDGQNTLQITWYRNSDDGLVTFLNTGYQAFDDFEAGDYRITIEVKSGQLVSTESFTLRVNPRPPVIPPDDTDGDEIPDWWEVQEGTDRYIKDSDKDPDLDTFTNMQEYANGTRPNDWRSHPAVPPRAVDQSSLTITEGKMWLLLVALAIIVLAVIIAMMVARAKKNKAEKRIKAVRNMRKIMPSVSWDHLTAASYMAAASSSGMMPSAPSGPALPGASSAIPPEQTLPPAPDHVVAQAEAQPQQPVQ